MELTLWTYEGPPHVGAMRIAASMEGVHYVLHAPQGDTYADLLFTMIERRDRRPPVTYTTFQARDLGGDTAELVKRSIAEAVQRFQPEALLVGESCTAELIQDQPGALAAGMDLGYEGDEHLHIEGDALQLREALSNLIDNALRYTPRGSSITLRVRQDSDGARLAVEDNGPGLSSDDLQHVFQRFWRASERPGGCGLGLAIVQEIAHRHGGEATVQSLQPQGLRIELRLV